MSFGMIDTEVRQQTREVRRQAAAGRVPQPARPARAADSSPARSLAMTRPPEAALRGQRHGSGLRSRVGFTLVETGLRLLASGQQAHG
jgi:hypothetical protein